VTAFLRPDDRWFVTVDPSSRSDSYKSLQAAVADNTASDLYAAVEETDLEALGIFTRLGFTVKRRESNYVVPTDPQVTGLNAALPDGIVIISAIDADEDDMRLLDVVLRQDVPGTAGWRWDPADFHAETFDSQFDPATYLIAVNAASGDYVGLVRGVEQPGSTTTRADRCSGTIPPPGPGRRAPHPGVLGPARTRQNPRHSRGGRHKHRIAQAAASAGCQAGRRHRRGHQAS
jgi:hypothetical protein